MAIHYSKRQPDGSVEYYDSKEEMESANNTPSLVVSASRPFWTGNLDIRHGLTIKMR